MMLAGHSNYGEKRAELTVFDSVASYPQLVSETPGWDAIDTALRPIYGDVEPMHWGTLLRWRLGGPDPLDGVSAYLRTDPVPHWHYVSYGMSELYDKESSDPDVSGWGFEFAFRLARDPADTEPPIWVASLMQYLARYVYQSGNWFEPGHHMDLNGPLVADGSLLCAIIFTLDPELGEITTPNGNVQFLQFVGITEDEYGVTQEWKGASFLDVIAERQPLLVTDVKRGSLLSDPGVAAAVRDGIVRDGSSCGALFVEVTGFSTQGEHTTLTFGALPAPKIARVLRGRLPFGRELQVSSKDNAIVFCHGDDLSVSQPDETTLQVSVPDGALPRLLDALQARAGLYEVTPSLAVRIVPSEIVDERGNETGRVVG